MTLGKSAISPISMTLSASMFLCVSYFRAHRSYVDKHQNCKNDIYIF